MTIVLLRISSHREKRDWHDTHYACALCSSLILYAAIFHRVSWSSSAIVCPGKHSNRTRLTLRRFCDITRFHEPYNFVFPMPYRLNMLMNLFKTNHRFRTNVSLCFLWRGGTRQTSPYSLCAECAAGCSLRTSSAGGNGRSAAGSAWSRRREQGEEKRSHEHEHVDEVKDSLLEPRCVCARCDVLTHKKKGNSARSCSDNVEVSESGHVVIGVRIVQCHHAIMDNC